MKLNHGLHLTYCTNVHRGENWAQTFQGLEQYTLAVRHRVGSSEAFGIGLRLSAQAARELSDPAVQLAFQKWLEKNGCYIFTINGFPFGRFHGGRVKEQVFLPDWTQRERLDYTNLLFDLLDQLAPPGIEGSVSTLPGSFKEFIREKSQVAEIKKNLWQCVEHISKLSEKANRKLHLGLEPEPLGLFETSTETVQFFEELAAEHPNDSRLAQHLGVNYDTCHMAVQFEEAHDVVERFNRHGIKISKIHLSSALKVRSTRETCQALSRFVDDVYLHQVIARQENGQIIRYKDLDLALAQASASGFPEQDWRIHFHIPLHSPQMPLFGNTSSHITDLFGILKTQPHLCPHFEIETYTWEVLPPELKNENVVTQLTREYEWCLKQMRTFGNLMQSPGR
jgi:hypothetical protein